MASRIGKSFINDEIRIEKAGPVKAFLGDVPVWSRLGLVKTHAQSRRDEISPRMGGRVEIGKLQRKAPASFVRPAGTGRSKGAAIAQAGGERQTTGPVDRGAQLIPSDCIVHPRGHATTKVFALAEG